ncbi:hypothetical protein VE03_04490 [Pseudogymnoascus sp. 23342-1-I1]|nr:hypothetical protein VE03_04490 [Pseudogymnoascus sp. 23342-1-I1]
MKFQASTLAALVAIPAVSATLGWPWINPPNGIGHGGKQKDNDLLHTLAVKAGKKYFGTATDNGELNNKDYTDILNNRKQFGQLTPSNGQKWMYIEPEQNVFNFTNGEVVGNLAKKNGQILRCHTLVWHSQLPEWVEFGNWTKETLSAVVVNHITKVLTQWKGKCYAWDVVNEAFNDDGTFRETVFYNVLGEDYFALAFKTAAKIDPSAKLYINDYNLEARSDKTRAVQKLVRSLKKQNVRIDGVGAQAHLVVGSTPTLAEQIQNLQDFVATGVEVAQTELDIRLELPVNATNLAQQSIDYENTVGACVAVKGCVGTTIWDFYDPYSWVPSVFDGEGAATLYFEDFTKHPAYWGVVRALASGAKHPHWPAPFHN